MGWSCRKDASDTLHSFQDSCVKQTGSSNKWEDNNNTYFLEISRKEHDDGAITGSVYKMLPDSRCRKSGSFRIEGHGAVSRGPKALKLHSK